MRKLKSRSLSH